MGLLTPFVGLLAILALPIVVAYFARRRAPKAVVGSTMLLRAAQGVASSRRAVARLRHPLSLLLVVCTLVALLVGLAGPRCGPSTEGRLIIVMDRSASMARKTEGGETLLQAGRDQVRTRLGMTAADAVSLVLTGEEPSVAVGLTPDRSQINRALDDTMASGGGTVSSAIALADRLCGNVKRDRIWVVSDGGRVPETRCDVQAILLPKAGSNIGISALRGRVADGLGMVETLVAVTSDGGVARSVDVELFMEGRLVDSFGIEVPGTGSAWTLRRLDGVGQNLKARIVGDGGSSSADDVASVTLNERPTVQVGLVTRQPDGFLATALRLHPGANVEVVAPDGALTLRGKDLVVMEASAVMPAEGSVVAFGEAAISLGFGDGDALENPKVTRWSFDDPLFRYVDLDDVVVRTARPLAVPEGGRSLIDAGGVPLAVVGQRNGRSTVAFGFGTGDTDLVLRVGFLHLVANVLESATPVVARAPGVRRGAPGVAEILADPANELAEFAALGTPGLRGWPWWSVAVLVAMVLLIGETITGVLRPWRRVSQLRIGAAWVIRLAVFGVLLASLLGLRLTVPAGTPTVVFVVDRSASVDDAGFAEARAKIEAIRREIGDSSRLGLVFVDGTATVATAPGGKWAWPQDVRATREERTDIGTGVQVGLGLIDSGSGGRIVLVTDGGDTGERLAAAREAATRAGVAVDVVLLKERVADPAIVDFSLDSDVVRPGQTLGGTVVLRGLEGSLSGTLQVRVDDVLLTEQSLTLSSRRQRVRFEHPLPDDLTVGPRRVEAQLVVDGPDPEPGNNRRTVGVTVGAPARALVVSSRPVELEAVVRALRAEDMQVFVERPEDVGPNDLALTDVVILGDVPVAAERGVEAGLSDAFVEALRPWVSTGGGLVTFGGDKTYELGGWSGTPLAAVLPLDLTADAEDVEPAVTLIQVLDNSASMGDWSGVHTKMSLANEGAVASMRLLRKKDQLGVMAVNTEIRWVARAQAVTDPLRLSAAIRGIRPSGGGIYTYSALIEAERAVAAADTPIKHVVIYADAQDAEEKTKGTELGYGTGPSSFGVAERLRRSGATISVIALGDLRDQDVPFLERLAVIGGGRFRITREAKELRALFVEETRQVVRSVVHDGSFFVKTQTPHPMLQGVDMSRAPALLGYVEVKARPTADVLLLGPKDRPILVSWQYGLGNVASWSTDLGGRWGRRWLPWPDYSRLVVQQVRWALRPPVARGAGVDVRPHHDGVRIMVTRLDDEGLALPDGGLTARLDGGEEPMDVSLSPVEPGTWTGVAPLDVGSARTLVLMDATTGAELARQDLVVPAPAERDGLSRDRVAALAAATGGVLQPDRVGQASEGRGRSRRIGWFLALFAVLLLPIDAWIRIPPRG